MLPTDRLRRALHTWTRLHGAVSIELAGHLGPMGIDPELLFRSEVEELLAAR